MDNKDPFEGNPFSELKHAMIRVYFKEYKKLGYPYGKSIEGMEMWLKLGCPVGD